MPKEIPTLHMLCGKIAAGKSTLAARLGRLPRTVLMAEDDWLNALFAEDLHSLRDYARCSSRLRRIVGPHVAALLKAGISVVLDFPANTAEQRSWMREILGQVDAAHQLHVLAVPDEVCLARLRERTLQGGHPFSVSEAQFHQFSSHFAEPSRDEGFNVVRYEQGV